MILFKNVDLIDLPAILEKGILPISKTGNNNWEDNKRVNNSKEHVYLFSPIEGKKHSFVQYGIVLLEVDVPLAKESKMAENDSNQGEYLEYIVEEVKPDEIKRVYIPSLFKEYPCVETMGNEYYPDPYKIVEEFDSITKEKIVFIEITAQIYKEGKYIDADKEELIKFAKTCGNIEETNSCGYYSYLSGYEVNEKKQKEPYRLYNIDYIIKESGGK